MRNTEGFNDVEMHLLGDPHFIFVVNNFKAFGGAERQSLILATYLQEHVSKKVSFIAFQDGDGFKSLLKEQGLDTYYFPFDHKASKFKKILQYWKLIKFMKTLKPDVLIPYVAESNKIVAQIWTYTGAKFAFWNQREEGRQLYGTPLEKKLINKVSAIVSNSFEGKDALMRTYGLRDEQIHVINNGIIPYNSKFEFRDWHQEFDIDRDRPLISMIANITDRKDHATLIKAWKLVIDDCKKTNKILPFLMLAGRKDTAYNGLRLLAFDLKLSDHLAFVGDLNPVQPLIEQSYFCVFSSNLEGCPNGVLECMERGKAVVGTNISGVRQALGDTYSKQCLSEPNNPQNLAKKIIDLYDDKNLIHIIESYNLQRILNEFSPEKMAKAHLDLISTNIIQKG